MLVRAGKEASVAATKTYTGQMLALYLLASALGGAVRLEDLRRIPEWVERVLRLEARIAAVAERYRFMTRTVTVGRGLNYANALEFGLKLMETCYVLAEGFSAADLMHGPIALVQDSFPVFVFAPGGPTWPSVNRVLSRLDELHADTFVITDIRNRPACRGRRGLELPAGPRTGGRIPDLYAPIPYIVPAQLFAAHLAAIKGLNPDRPRTLKKITRTL
jgi:glucosamine--fructose-6-phosphate aminotransferase (isomerizing)